MHLQGSDWHRDDFNAREALTRFTAACDYWSISEHDRWVLAGAPSQESYRLWLVAAPDDAPLRLGLEAKLRIGCLVDIHEHVNKLYGDRGADWVHQLRPETMFCVATPLEMMLEGGSREMLRIARYIEAIRKASADPVMAMEASRAKQ